VGKSQGFSPLAALFGLAASLDEDPYGVASIWDPSTTHGELAPAFGPLKSEKGGRSDIAKPDKNGERQEELIPPGYVTERGEKGLEGQMLHRHML
jgi:hypothetical protein